MYLGIINGWEEGHFKAVADKGLHGVEFCANHNYDSAEILAKAQDIRAYSEKYDVKVGSVGRWGMDRLTADGAIIPEAQQHDKNLIDLCAAVGCPVYNVGCNYPQNLDYAAACEKAIEVFTALIDYARPKGVKIGVYNCDWANFVYNEKAWSYILLRVPELGIKYDPSHCYHRGGDYLKELRDWGDRVYHVHLKGTMDVDGESYDDCPAGMGDIKWPQVMVILSNKGYDGMLSIEPHSGNWRGGKGQWGIDYTIRYMTPLIMPDSYKTMQTDPYMP